MCASGFYLNIHNKVLNIPRIGQVGVHQSLAFHLPTPSCKHVNAEAVSGWNPWNSEKSHVKHYKFKESHLCLSWFEDLHYKNNLFFSKNLVHSGEHGASLVPDWPRKRFNLSSTKSNCHHPNDWIETNYQTKPDAQVERFTSDILKNFLWCTPIPVPTTLCIIIIIIVVVIIIIIINNSMILWKQIQTLKGSSRIFSQTRYVTYLHPHKPSTECLDMLRLYKYSFHTHC